MYEVRRLRLLKELADRGTLAEVATALRFSPSSVSQQLDLLEREVGVPLLLRAGRGVVLTPDAELLVGHARRVLDVLERAEAEIAARSQRATGVVRLAIFQSAALALLPATLSRMADDHPGVRVEAVQYEPEQALRRTAMLDFDLVVAEQYPGHATAWHDGLDRHPLVRDALRLAAPPDSALRGIADAAGSPWVMEPQGAASRHWAEQRCREAGFEPDVRYESADLQVHMRLVESGHAVALMPDLAWAGHDVTARLTELGDRPQRTVFSAARRASADRPAVVALRATLESAALTQSG